MWKGRGAISAPVKKDIAPGLIKLNIFFFSSVVALFGGDFFAKMAAGE
jgi:hypothetical protein